MKVLLENTAQKQRKEGRKTGLKMTRSIYFINRDLGKLLLLF